MPFNQRISRTTQAIEIISRHIWYSKPIADRIFIVPFGYETHIPDHIKQKLISMRNSTAKYVRFAPDYLLIDEKKFDQQNERLTYLFDYKVTQTPIYSTRRIADLAAGAGISGLTPADVSQMETDAYENYMALHRMNVRVVVLNYCAYHPRLLLCDYIQNVKVLGQFLVTTTTHTGSRTPFTNFYCRSMRTFREFLLKEHDIRVDEMAYTALCDELQQELPITHDINSPLHPSKQQHQPPQ